FCRGAFLQSFSGLLPGFPGGTAIDLSKELVKKFIIGKTVSIYDFHNRILCRNQIMVNMGYPHLVYMTGKVDSHLLLKEAAEIFPVQAKFSCDIFQEYGVGVVFFYI